MTIDEFFAELSKHRDRGWHLDGVMIRDRAGVCPICAVAGRETSKDNISAGVVGVDELGLDGFDMGLIVDAADRDRGREWAWASRDIRDRLLDTLGIGEPAR